MGRFSTYLFAEPSFAEGMGRIFDWTGTLNQYNSSPTGADADDLAMTIDWTAIGSDFLSAVEQYAEDAGVPRERVEAIAAKAK